MPTLEEVDNYAGSNLLIPRIVKVHNVSTEFAQAIFKEFKRFLYMYSVTKASVAPSAEVDIAWHEMLMFTKDYQEFCKFLGTGFIHHVPDGGVAGTGKTYQETKEHYKKFFGIDPDPKYWP